MKHEDNAHPGQIAQGLSAPTPRQAHSSFWQTVGAFQSKTAPILTQTDIPSASIFLHVTIMTNLPIHIIQIAIDDTERKVLNTGSTGPVCIYRLI